ncbi:MAG TPA: hypothetical protein VH640_06260, partial [Bryobacteraceae bacterium]
DRFPKKRRIELLEQAFQSAAASPVPYKRHSALARIQAPSGFLEHAYSLDLDALSLRLRAVQALLPLDPQRARARFEDIPPIDLPNLTCDDFMAYDVSRYYQVLPDVAAQGFTAKEAREEEPIKFLTRYAAINYPAQIAPAARMLAGNLSIPDSAFQSLVTAFAGNLSRIGGDDRSFTDAAREAGPAIAALAQTSARRGLAPVVVLGAYREFLVSHLTAARCEEPDAAGSSADPADYFNSHLRTAAVGNIDDVERTPSKREGKPQGLAACDSPECQNIRAQYQSLIFKDSAQAVQESERQSIDWQIHVRDFLSALASWNDSSGMPPVQYFREKIEFYNQLIAIVPKGETLDYVFSSMLSFLIASRPSGEDQIEWYLPVIQLVGRAALNPGAFERAAADLRQANDSAIALEMALELVAPHPVNEFMLLL